uniref:Uncharacterized protein n=1 Tax=Anguilla anguilla TaxID=7936 RepID=A0A0E9Q552_ANGAN
MSSKALRVSQLKERTKWCSNLADRIDVVTSADSYTPRA